MDYLEGVHVFIRRPASSRAAVHQAGQAHRLDHSAAGVSDEERAQDLAVGHYLEHDRCIAAAVNALGYPSRSLLSAWLQELHTQERARIVGRSQELAPATKQSAVIALCMRPSSAQAVAEELGVSRGSLYKWKNQLLGHDAPASMKRQQDPPASPDRTALEQQLETLQRDIRRLHLEKDLLKKANELLKKEVGIDRQSLTNREKTQLVDALRPIYTLTELLCCSAKWACRAAPISTIGPGSRSRTSTSKRDRQ